MFLHQQRIDYTKRAYKSLDKAGENQVGKQLKINKIRIIVVIKKTLKLFSFGLSVFNLHLLKTFLKK